jgi:hypothetical protein
MRLSFYSKLFLLTFALISLSNGCRSKKVKQTTKEEKPSIAPIQVKATYSSYPAAMGSGKGLLFNIQIITDQQVHIDSLIIGGKAMNYSMLNTNPITLESNYFISRPEPSEANPNPKLPNDAMIDQKEFYPAYMILKVDKMASIKLPISEFIKNTN